MEKEMENMRDRERERGKGRKRWGEVAGLYAYGEIE